jgi:hypothetical protein
MAMPYLFSLLYRIYLSLRCNKEVKETLYMNLRVSKWPRHRAVIFSDQEALIVALPFRLYMTILRRTLPFRSVIARVSKEQLSSAFYLSFCKQHMGRGSITLLYSIRLLGIAISSYSSSTRWHNHVWLVDIQYSSAI